MTYEDAFRDAAIAKNEATERRFMAEKALVDAKEAEHAAARELSRCRLCWERYTLGDDAHDRLVEGDFFFMPKLST